MKEKIGEDPNPKQKHVNWMQSPGNSTIVVNKEGEYI
jgi:hypothetical protein